MSGWSSAEMGDQAGRTVIVTGANSGLGAVTARELAAHGASVVMACRDVGKGEQAREAIVKDHPGADVEVRALDLADLSSVYEFAKDVSTFDVLINNAGVMAVPKSRTKDGFEMQFGTNHLGHFALTGLLLGRIRDRVVTVSSMAHTLGSIDFDDLNWEKRNYQRWRAYGQSKLANLLFAYELQRRLAAAGSPVRSVAAHPGYASTNLQSHTQSVQDKLMGITNLILAQSAFAGAQPSLYAATAPSIPGGSFVGPGGFRGMRGAPVLARSNRHSRDVAVAGRLWEESEALTGVVYDIRQRR
ncbi:SDR family NAD(P)-dependent oxidoreductase [Hoyosella sp. G463]|uniref:SDR family NAD(P)-dependent oxidoreductase n=1 Tax=Lolliginicoccus lacisalsi TaxID=2742202 RepID=A0A927PKL3_9ACTN|nr:oxidoreductase [Lolliginicoccus lacisalsi]MBD8505848.1 SDR family NAD(P)-dependent oxidoreductase [Lolliginicoccus lacisalsi]